MQKKYQKWGNDYLPNQKSNKWLCQVKNNYNNTLSKGKFKRKNKKLKNPMVCIILNYNQFY